MKKLILFKVMALNIVVLCAQNEHRPEIHCKHFIYGYPFGTPATNDLIIRDVYALSNNDNTKFADWVCYRLDTAIISGPKRTRNWKADPWLDEKETLEPRPDDYKAANATLKTDRGHQAPLASFDGAEDWFEVNYLSNITPQKSNLNQGTWMRLEGKVRDLVEEVFENVYVMTGTLYERDMPSLPECDELHKVPSGYWKIIIWKESDTKLHTASFIFDQDTPRNDKIQAHLCTIGEIEQRSKLDFLWLLDDPIEETIETTKNETWTLSHFSE